MSVPKTSVDKNGFFPSNECDIWPSWQVAAMKAIPRVSELSQNLSDFLLWPGVLAPYAPHVFAAAERRDALSTSFS
jgi:hypothetical protein